MLEFIDFLNYFILFSLFRFLNRTNGLFPFRSNTMLNYFLIFFSIFCLFFLCLRFLRPENLLFILLFYTLLSSKTQSATFVLLDRSCTKISIWKIKLKFKIVPSDRLLNRRPRAYQIVGKRMSVVTSQAGFLLTKSK